MRNNNGFSLLEVMVGMVILAIGLLGTVAMTTTSIRINANANHLSEAMNIGQAELEQLKITPWGTLVNGSRAVTSRTGAVFTSGWSVSTIGNMKDVTLRISWVDRVNHDITLRTKIAR